MWHYFDQKPEQEMLADMVEEYNSLQDDIHINATFVSRTELMNQYTVGALSGELPDIGTGRFTGYGILHISRSIRRYH